MAKHDPGYYAAQFLNPIGPVGLIYEGVAEGIASGRQASADADMSKANAAAARARATEQQARADQAAAAARQKIAEAAAAEKSAGAAPAPAPERPRGGFAGVVQFPQGRASSLEAASSMSPLYIAAIAVVVAGGAYYLLRGKR